MRNEHLEFEQLAVEHVLGGLAPDASARFRDHLIGCVDCRQHVVELRGIASDLDLAARQERAVVRTKPETDRGESEDSSEAGEQTGTLGWTPSHVRNAVIVVLAIALAVLSFWNIHLRQVVDGQVGALEGRSEVLDILLEGEVVPLTSTADGLQVDVAATRTAIAVNASGIPVLEVGERLVLWGLVPVAGDAQPRWEVLAFVNPEGVPDGRAALAATLVGHRDIHLAIESFPFGDEPAGPTLFTATLDR